MISRTNIVSVHRSIDLSPGSQDPTLTETGSTGVNPARDGSPETGGFRPNRAGRSQPRVGANRWKHCLITRKLWFRANLDSEQTLIQSKP